MINLEELPPAPVGYEWGIFLKDTKEGEDTSAYVSLTPVEGETVLPHYTEEISIVTDADTVSLLLSANYCLREFRRQEKVAHKKYWRESYPHRLI